VIVTPRSGSRHPNDSVIVGSFSDPSNNRQDETDKPQPRNLILEELKKRKGGAS